LDQIKTMTGLRSLNLFNSKVTAAGIADLKRALPELTLVN